MLGATRKFRGQLRQQACSVEEARRILSPPSRSPPRPDPSLPCRHPTGIADWIAVYDALKTVRRDLCFYANADAHRVSPRFGDVLIPVEWVEAKRNRQTARLTLEETRAAMEAERCLVVFPAGRL